jgi:hypothetical protein
MSDTKRFRATIDSTSFFLRSPLRSAENRRFFGQINESSILGVAFPAQGDTPLTSKASTMSEPTIAADCKGRKADRESIFILCDIGRADGRLAAQVRVRNVSSTGMMAETNVAFAVDELIIVAFRGHEPIYGTVSWARQRQIGIAFHIPVDPKTLRRQVSVALPTGATGATSQAVSAFQPG